MSNLQKYGEWDDATAAAEREEFDKASGNAEFWKVPQGKSLVRFLPPRPGKGSIFRYVWQHYVNAGNGPMAKRVRIVCPLNQSKADKLTPRFCPVCAYADQLRASGNPEDYELAGEFIAQRKVYASILVRGEEERGIRVWEFGKKVYEGLDAIRRDENAGGNFAHPVRGFDIVVDRKGTGKKDTEYKVFPARQMSPLHPDAATMEALLETMPDLDRYARIVSEDELRRIWSEVAVGGHGPPGGGHRPPPQGRGGFGAPRGGGAPRQRTAADVIDTSGEDVDY